ncbi:myocyte-specific enhancer factor 2 isoform X3 [Drosophila persimilis]|uniref:Myocyte-specific enhancer factor 2 isoform X4 n=1 Tax=Drosophila pseudoobscura pseudoobscura TaxID=46245 RepID=A0A6I8VTH6_DROPS|nr:myocyte-specific enhancer factor 2 isoform X3 [Drosophila persimilis]XP_033234218.1 myocyte-specific enhancer factor 2 isoform X4 [Drosophila pseudoobscura]
MGRKKIQISRITDERNRQVTFNKRKFGVMKKAYELSVLCDCEIALIIFSSSNKLYQYASTDMDRVLLKYTEYNEPHESLTNKNIIEKENKNGVMSPDSPEAETDYTLTPRTEAKYNKIDEEFQNMMQRNQMAIGVTGAPRQLPNSSYTLPVSVPVPGSYGENLLQASPQMSHTNISPRPSSSETDSGGMSLIIYPSGSMLEMSNGYPHSHSPLVGSPSPGPSPGIAHHLPIKQQSPGSQNGRAANLRVVIPPTIATIPPNMSAPEDVAYTDIPPCSPFQQRQSQTSLNTPVVTLQTPIPALTSYSFGAQDFSSSGVIGSADIMSLPTWHQGLVQHSSLSHLAVSNSTPPPATSPVSIKVKAEPQSPPRDLSASGHQQNSNGSTGSGGSSSSTSSNASAGGGGAGSSAANAGNVITHLNNASILGGGGPPGGGGGGSNGNAEQATNLSVLGHSQQHLVMPNSRPSSTGHLTPTPDFIILNAGAPSSEQDVRLAAVAVQQQQQHQQQQQQQHQQHQQQQQQLGDYDAPNHKRPRISGGWGT